jgi:hypothetical protein
LQLGAAVQADAARFKVLMFSGANREALALFGYPITEPAMETNSSGDTVLTQWFERARFECHPTIPPNTACSWASFGPRRMPRLLRYNLRKDLLILNERNDLSVQLARPGTYRLSLPSAIYL